MTAAVRLAMAHLAEQVGAAPLHIIGYSTGASLALNHALDAADDLVSPMPASLLLISPAIRVHGTASLAGFKDTLGAVPGMGGMNWLTIMPEFDPFKYNSFATNAGDVVHQLTRTVDRRIAAHAAAGTTIELPPIIAFKSTVDATVSTEAIVDNLLMRLSPGRSELVLFDINRMAAKATLLIGDPGPLTTRLLAEDSLPFGLTIVGNVGTDSRQVSALYRPPQSTGLVATELPEGQWPDYVYSLSHIALPIPADDPLYGTVRPDDPDSLFLGEIAMRGERGIYKIPADWLVRMRYNPFYDILEARAIEWIENAPPDG